MKTISRIVLALFLASTSSLAFENFPLTGWQASTYREDVFTLNSHSQLDITLDCGSFLYGVTVKRPGSENFLMLYESECYAIYDSLRTWFEAGEQACLKLDFTGKDWDLLKSTYDCQ